MNGESLILERHLKKVTLTSNIISVIVALATALSVGYGFYYNTNSTLDSHTEQIKEVQTSVKTLTEAVNNTAVFQGASKEQIKAVQDQIVDVKKSQERIEDKLDKLILNK